MVRETHADPELADFVEKNFIPVRLEARNNPSLAQKWNVRGVPLTLILAPNERELKRLEGFQPASHILGELKKIHQNIEFV
jgi:uncharacterized protein YyaL (SSP411 family)